MGKAFIRFFQGFLTLSLISVFRRTNSEKVYRVGDFFVAMTVILLGLFVIRCAFPVLLVGGLFFGACYWLSKIITKIRHSRD